MIITHGAPQARLGQLQHLEAAGAIAGGLAHNLNNIIAAIVGYAEMVAELCEKGTSLSDHVHEILRAGARAAELVDTMVTFGRRDRRRDAVEISSLLEETVLLLRVLLPAEVCLTIRNEAGNATVIGRAAELQQVILNLVRNAAQAIERSGTVDVRVSNAEVRAARDGVIGRLGTGQHLLMAVSDTGRGIDQAKFRQVFEPYVTTRQTGTGLGLATVAEIVLDHGGAIDVRSASGGTTFEVWLPSEAEGCPRTLTPRGD